MAEKIDNGLWEIYNQRKTAIDEMPKKIIDLIYREFPDGISTNQVKLILNETWELTKNMPLEKSHIFYSEEKEVNVEKLADDEYLNSQIL